MYIVANYVYYYKSLIVPIELTFLADNIQSISADHSFQKIHVF